MMRRLILAALCCAALIAPAPAAFTPPPVPQGSYTPFTPTISAGSGTLTTVSATGRWQQTGKRIDYAINISITTNGTGAQDVRATLPVPALAGVTQVGFGRNIATGPMLQAAVFGGSTLIINRYDNTYPGADGAVLIVSGSYEAQ